MEMFVPVTPGGSVLVELKRNSEAAAWAALLRDAGHMPYKTIEAFKKRGYVVEPYTTT